MRENEEHGAVIEVSVLGELNLRLGDNIISDKTGRSLKLWSVLCYVILHRQRMVTQNELIETFWPEEDRSSPLSALKMLIMRIRNTLKPLLGDEVEPILGRRGGYQWNPDLPIWVDAEEFERLCTQAAGSSGDQEAKMASYSRAMELYKGDLLPRQSDQQWVVPLSTRYHDRYVTAVKDYAALLEQERRFDEMSALCIRASQLNPIDETLHILVVRALLKEHKNAAALRHYEKATELLYQNLGVRPSEELRSLYIAIMAEEKNMEEDLDQILNELQEEPGKRGAYLVEYGVFKSLYRLEARRAIRSGACMHLCLLTISTQAGTTPPLKVLNTVMRQLQETVVQSLRQGDVVCRYSKAQFIIMLPNANLEDSGMVMERIIAAFYRRHYKNVLNLSYRIRELRLS